MAVKKLLYKSKENKVIFGVFGGLGEFLDIDPTLLRLGWVLISVFTGFVPGLIVYIIAALIVPGKPAKKQS